MAEDSAVLTETEAAPSIDMEKAVNSISESLFPEQPEKEVEASPQEKVAEAIAEPTIPLSKEQQATIRQAPKSWAKDVHPIWEKIDPKAQDYIEKREREMADGASQYKDFAEYGKSIQAVLAPYQPLLQSKGLQAPAVVNDLLQTYTHLTQGTMEQRQAALLQVAKNLQIAMPATSADQAQANPLDPRLQTIEQQLQEMRDIQTAQQQAALNAAREKATLDVNAFASDPKNALFDEVHEDLIKFLKMGDSLQEAYDKAVWANPVTREKQVQARLQTETEKALERKRLDALPKQKARGVNVNGKDTHRTPTEAVGSMEETLRSTFRAIKDKTVH